VSCDSHMDIVHMTSKFPPTHREITSASVPFALSVSASDAKDNPNLDEMRLYLFAYYFTLIMQISQQQS